MDAPPCCYQSQSNPAVEQVVLSWGGGPLAILSLSLTLALSLSLSLSLSQVVLSWGGGPLAILALDLGPVACGRFGLQEVAVHSQCLRPETLF